MLKRVQFCHGGAMAPPSKSGRKTPSTTPPVEFTEPIDYPPPPPRNRAGKLRQLLPPSNSPSNSRNPSTTPPPLEINRAGKLRQLPPLSNSRNPSTTPPPSKSGRENSVNYPPPLEFTEPIDYPPPLEIGPENSANYPPPLEFTARNGNWPPQIQFLDPPLGQRSIFITGGAGFIGKQTIEKLLRSCPSVDSVYVLLRTKKQKTVDERLREMLSSPVR